jgi:hypothetical protein
MGKRPWRGGYIICVSLLNKIFVFTRCFSLLINTSIYINPIFYLSVKIKPVVQFSEVQTGKTFLLFLLHDSLLICISEHSPSKMVIITAYILLVVISVISWPSVLLVEQNGVPTENHWPVESHWQNLSHNVVSSTPRLSGIQTLNVGVDLHFMTFSSYH